MGFGLCLNALLDHSQPYDLHELQVQRVPLCAQQQLVHHVLHLHLVLHLHALHLHLVLKLHVLHHHRILLLLLHHLALHLHLHHA